MRAFLQAGLLLAPALTCALVLPSPEAVSWHGGKSDAKHGPGKHRKCDGPSSASIDVSVPGISGSLESLNLLFKVDVLKSKDVCGEGKVLINGDSLPQEPQDDKLSGHGPLTVGDHTILASWDFSCVVDRNGNPDAQLLVFAIETVDEQKTTNDPGFTVLFKQHIKKPTILDSTSIPLVDGHASDELEEDHGRGEGHKIDKHQKHHGHHEDTDREMNIEEELADFHWMEYQLRELEWQIAEKKQIIHDLFQAKLEAELAKCDSIKCTAKAVLHKAKGLAHTLLSALEYGKSHSNSHMKGEGYDQPGFEHEGHKHRRPSHPRPPRHGNHSFPHPPHFRKPHHLPICHFPPPPYGPKHGFPHGPPSDLEDGPHHVPPMNGDVEHRLPPSFDGPFQTHGAHPAPPTEGEYLPPSAEFDGLPPTDGDLGFSPPPPHSHHRFEHHHRGPFHIFHFAKYLIVGLLVSLLLITFHRRCCCNPSRRAAKQARREVRSRRRQQRRTERKEAWMAWASKLCRFIPATSADYEEKRAILAGDSADESVLSEIRQLKNAASVVDDMVAAEEGRTASRSSIDTALPEYASDSGDCLPSYDDTETEVSSMVSNGFRPADYTPPSSDSGSVGSVIGGDVKE